MALDLADCQFRGPALPDPFVKLDLEKELTKRKLLPKTTGKEGKELQKDWDIFRRKLRALSASGGPIRVRNHVLEPLAGHLGYTKRQDAEKVRTREDLEDGGSLFLTDDMCFSTRHAEITAHSRPSSNLPAIRMPDLLSLSTLRSYQGYPVEI